VLLTLRLSNPVFGFWTLSYFPPKLPRLSGANAFGHQQYIRAARWFPAFPRFGGKSGNLPSVRNEKIPGSADFFPVRKAGNF
jgi:hypothetical protein